MEQTRIEQHRTTPIRTECDRAGHNRIEHDRHNVME